MKQNSSCLAPGVIGAGGGAPFSSSEAALSLEGGAASEALAADLAMPLSRLTLIKLRLGLGGGVGTTRAAGECSGASETVASARAV